MAKATSKKEAGQIKIVLLPERWVFVGRYSKRIENGVFIHRLENSKNIRHWGTGKGLGDLGINGVAGRTVTLDQAGTIEFENYIALHDCVADKWAGVL